MSYASKIKAKKFSWGGTALYAKFPAHGEISIVGSVSGGARLAGSAEFADAHAAMLLEGTAKKSKADIQILLDDIGATVAFSADKDRLAFNARVRAVHAKRLIGLIAEVLREPSFPAKEIIHFKQRLMAELSLEAQDTRAQAAIRLAQMLFFKDHPNWQESTADSRAILENLTRKDLQRYHARAIDRRSLIVSISGDIAQSDAFALVDAAFSKLPAADVALAPFSRATPHTAQRALAPIPGKSSIDYMLGVAAGIDADHADYPALLLGLQILGNRGGFTGRLMQTVRESEGLTYGVYAYPSGFQRADGYSVVWGTFAPELFERGRASVMREIKKIVEHGASELETKKHREMFEARSRVLLASSFDLARAAHDVAANGKSPPYLDEFPQRVAKLRAKEVNNALKKYLIVDDLSESAAGPV